MISKNDYEILKFIYNHGETPINKVLERFNVNSYYLTILMQNNFIYYPTADKVIITSNGLSVIEEYTYNSKQLDISQEATIIAKEANKIAEQANKLASLANDIAKEANNNSDESNKLSNKAIFVSEKARKTSLIMSIISISVSIFSIIVSILISFLT